MVRTVSSQADNNATTNTTTHHLQPSASDITFQPHELQNVASGINTRVSAPQIHDPDSPSTGTLPWTHDLLDFLCPTAHLHLLPETPSELPIATVRLAAGKRSLRSK